MPLLTNTHHERTAGKYAMYKNKIKIICSFLCYSLSLFPQAQEPEIYQQFDKVPTLAARRDKAELYKKLAHACSSGSPLLLAQTIDHADCLALFTVATDKELVAFAQATDYKNFKLFVDNYYDLFLDTLEIMSEEQLKLYISALPLDFLKAVLFDTSQTRVDQLTQKLSIEKMSILVTVTGQKMPNYTLKKEQLKKNNFIRIEAFNRLFASLSINQLNALLAASSAKVLSELLALFNS